MRYETFQDLISKIKNLELPGEHAHEIMSPPFRKHLEKRVLEKEKKVKKAAVMALFYPNHLNEAMLVLILRNSYKGVHSAQIGFPGGKIELEDSSIEAAALRETEEEIGVSQNLVQVIRPMSPIYIPPSNFLVYPFLGMAHQNLKFKKQDDEVQDVIQVRVADFLSSNNVVNTLVPTSYKVEVEVPAFRLNNHIVWGATAMMLSEIKVVLKQSF